MAVPITAGEKVAVMHGWVCPADHDSATAPPAETVSNTKQGMLVTQLTTEGICYFSSMHCDVEDSSLVHLAIRSFESLTRSSQTRPFTGQSELFSAETSAYSLSSNIPRILPAMRVVNAQCLMPAGAEGA